MNLDVFLAAIQRAPIHTYDDINVDDEFGVIRFAPILASSTPSRRMTGVDI